MDLSTAKCENCKSWNRNTPTHGICLLARHGSRDAMFSAGGCGLRTHRSFACNQYSAKPVTKLIATDVPPTT